MTAKPVAFFEVLSPEADRARQFYADLFGWQMSMDPTMEGYALVDTGAGEDAVAGGIGPSEGPEDAGVKIYVKVDDLDDQLSQARELGAPVVLEPMELPGGFGTIAVVLDPDGNPLGLWK